MNTYIFAYAYEGEDWAENKVKSVVANSWQMAKDKVLNLIMKEFDDIDEEIDSSDWEEVKDRLYKWGVYVSDVNDVEDI